MKTLTKIPNHSKYSITPNGRVYSHKQRPGWISGHTDKLGYKRLNATDDSGGRSNLYIHRAVALAFLPNPEGKPHVNHIDNNPSNNCVSNLEWVTAKENREHAAKQGRLPRLRGDKNGNSKYSLVLIRKVRQMYSNGFTQMDIKKKLGIPQPTVSVIVRNVQWKDM